MYIRCALESVVQIEQEVEALSIELLGILLEVIGTRLCRCLCALALCLGNTVVATALFITACRNLATVSQVAELQVNAERMVEHIELTTNACVESYL